MQNRPREITSGGRCNVKKITSYLQGYLHPARGLTVAAGHSGLAPPSVCSGCGGLLPGGVLFPQALVVVAPDVFLLVGELLAAGVSGVVGDFLVGACGEHALKVHLNGAGGGCDI